VLGATVWRRIVGVDRGVVIDAVEFDDEVDALVVSVRHHRRRRLRCGRCGRRSPGYDQGEGRRRWRTLDVGGLRCWVESDAPRVDCVAHGPTVCEFVWARHGAGHTRAFDDQVAWLAVHTSKTAVCELMRVAWRTVGSIVDRVVTEARAHEDPFDGLARIGIDEISRKRGYKYLTVVVDHDSGRLVWAAEGATKATLEQFFDLLGPDRAAQITHVTADAADWIAAVVADRCPNATQCADPFHMVAWATEALDEVRRGLWREAKKTGATPMITRIKGCRYALLKNPPRLNDRQRASLAKVKRLNGALWRAYLLKEQFRAVFQLRGAAAIAALDAWLARACRSRIPQMVELSRRVRRHRTTIDATLVHGLSNALVESTNTKLRLITRMGYGFRSVDNLIALCLLDRGGYCPPLPAR